MSIPLINEVNKNDINTSIIAIKRNIERINMLLGLVDSGSPDLSGLATKQELEDAITQVETDLAPVDEVTSGNMQSVSSNAVAEALSQIKDINNLSETVVGTYGGKPRYRYTMYDISNLAFKSPDLYSTRLVNSNIDKILKISGSLKFSIIGHTIPLNSKWSTFFFKENYVLYYFQEYTSDSANVAIYIEVEYTKTTD